MRVCRKDISMKLIFFDIDGTLIYGDSILIPESAKEAIRKARDNGHICMINSGRTKRMVEKEFTEQVEFDGFLYGCGTMAEYHNEILFHETFDRKQGQRIMDGLMRHKVDAILEGCENDYCDRPENMHTDFFREYTELYRKYSFGSFDDALEKYDKMYAYVDNHGKMAGFAEEFREDLDFIDREHGFYEIVPKGCSKASGIRYMAKLLGIPMEDTVAIGDSNNDLAMFECVGTSIAMGNSTQNILDMADYITTDVDKDGIFNALQWLGVI